MIYDKYYLNTYRKYRDTLNQQIVIVVKQTKDEGEHIYRTPAIVKTIDFTEDILEMLVCEISLIKEDLVKIVSDKGLLFPMSDVKNRIHYIIFNSKILYVNNKQSNFFDNILKLSCSNKI